MDIKTFLFATFIAAAYTSWPNLAKALNVKLGAILFVVLVVALVIAILVFWKDIAEIGSVPRKALFIIFAVAVANGLATYLCGAVAADKTVQTGIFLVVVFVLQMAFAPIADWLINHNKPSTLQYIGLGLAAPIMWLLAQSPKK